MKRNTSQRKIVMQALSEMSGHPTASQVYHHVHHDNPSISKATVFRILNQESEDGVIMRVQVHDNEMHYEIKNPPHYHMQCRCCGKIMDAPLSYQKDVEEQVSYMNGFQVEGHTMIFHGVCADCLKKQGIHTDDDMLD